MLGDRPTSVLVRCNVFAAGLRAGKIAGAALDVFDQEPLPIGHPFRSLPNVLATPHIGYVARELYARFYQDTITNILRWIDRRNSAQTAGIVAQVGKPT